jgi:ADP-ribose pyrophosphatase
MRIGPLFAGRIFSLSLEEHPLPGGENRPLEVIRHPGGAAALPVYADGSIVLLRQYRPIADGWLWEIPAGRLAPDEDPEACARRELQEETGLIAGSLQPLGKLLTTPGFCDERIDLFLATDLLAGPADPEADEHLQVLTLTVSEVQALLAQGEIIDGKTQLAILLYLYQQRQR